MSPRPGARSDAAARILIVDGDAAAAGTLAAGLRPALGVRSPARHARCGRDALDLLKAQAFDLVLADVASLADLAPQQEEALARLVRLAEGALTIALSDGVSVSAAVAAMRAGAHDFAARPITAEALAGRIRELARRHGKPALLAADHRPQPAALLSELNAALAQLQAATEAAGPAHPDALRQLRELAQQLASSVEGEMRGGNALQPAAPRPAPVPLQRRILPMWQQEQRIIEEAIVTYSGNIALAAAALELSPSTIYRKRQAWADEERRSGAA